MDDTMKKQMRDFANFLGEEYRAFVGREMGRNYGVPSQTDFAKWLGVPQTSFSNWINQVRPPNRDNLDIVADKLGPKVYDIFGVPRRLPKDRLARAIMERWPRLKDHQRKQLEELTANWIDENEKNQGDEDRSRFQSLSSPA